MMRWKEMEFPAHGSYEVGVGGELGRGLGIFELGVIGGDWGSRRVWGVNVFSKGVLLVLRWNP
jgi:hypothetical protein